MSKIIDQLRSELDFKSSSDLVDQGRYELAEELLQSVTESFGKYRIAAYDDDAGWVPLTVIAHNRYDDAVAHFEKAKSEYVARGYKRFRITCKETITTTKEIS